MSRLRAAALIGASLAGLLLVAPQVRAAGQLPTEIVIWPIEPTTIGSEVIVAVDLRLSGGGPLVDQPVELSSNGERLRRARTDTQGSASFWLPTDLLPGEYHLIASFPGSDQLLPAADEFVLVILPFELTVETVPPLPGMPFALDGARFVAGADGVARISVDRPGDHTLAVHDGEYLDAERRADFSRWNTDLFGPEIAVRIPLDRPLQAGFDIHMPAGQGFVALDGGTVDPSRITSFTLRSSLGTVFTYPDGRQRWFKASRAVRRPNGLESVFVQYNVDAVEVDGSNVVNAGQHRFYVEPGVTWQIELLLYSARLEARDALFGFPAGTAVDVTYPDGKVIQVTADQDGQLAVRSLARGIYRMTVADAPGWAPPMPVALSRNQDVVLRVITYLDMGVAALVASAIALGLLHRGRPHLIPRAVRAPAAGLVALRSHPLVAGGWSVRLRRRELQPARAAPDPTPPKVRATPQGGGWIVAYAPAAEDSQPKPRPAREERRRVAARAEDRDRTAAPKSVRPAKRQPAVHAGRQQPAAAYRPLPIASIAETISRGPWWPERMDREPLNPGKLAARRATYELIENLDPGRGDAEGQGQNVVPYPTRGVASPGTASGPPMNGDSFWEASAREVASATCMIGIQYCEQCGLMVSANAHFCRRCGTRLAVPTIDEAPGTAHSGRDRVLEAQSAGGGGPVRASSRRRSKRGSG